MTRPDVRTLSGRSAISTHARPLGPLPRHAIRETIGARMGDVDLHAWFHGEELETCRACGERAAIRVAATRPSLCLACGGVDTAEDASAIDVVGRSQEHS